MTSFRSLIQDSAGAIEPSAGLTDDGSAYLSADLQQEFDRSYNRRTFGFAHGLGGHSLFALPNLVALASRLEPHGHNYCSTGKIAVTDGWAGGTPLDRSAATSLAEAVSMIECNDSLVMLRGAIDDPLMGPALSGMRDRIVELAGPALKDDFTAARATILIASPNRITAYHADADVNFLMQVSGDKHFNVFDQTDRTLVTETDMERFFIGEENAIRFLPDRQQDAVSYDLRAGCGVHVPSLAPHWARNKDAVSVAVSFNFDLASVGRLASVHKVNHRLRRLGFHPGPTDGPKWRNQIKHGGVRAVLAARSLIRSLPLRNRGSATGN